MLLTMSQVKKNDLVYDEDGIGVLALRMDYYYITYNLDNPIRSTRDIRLSLCHKKFKLIRILLHGEDTSYE